MGRERVGRRRKMKEMEKHKKGTDTDGESDKSRESDRLFCKLLMDKDRLILPGRWCLVGGLRLL